MNIKYKIKNDEILILFRIKRSYDKFATPFIA